MRRKHFIAAHVNVSLQNWLGETEKIPVEARVKASDGLSNLSSYGLNSCKDFQISVTLTTNLSFCKNSAIQKFIKQLNIYPIS